MMLFSPEHIEPIISGRETQTRRMWKDTHPMVKVGGIYWAQTKLFDSSSRFARIHVMGLDWMPLDPMPDEDVYAEGYDSLEAFKEAFKRINHLGYWPFNEMVWRVKYEMVVGGIDG